MRRRCTLLAMPALLAACSNPLSRPFPDKQVFVLDAPRPGAPAPAARRRSIQVREVAGTTATDPRGLVRRLPGNRQDTDFWNEFAAPPARLVDDSLRRWLAASGAVDAVLDAGSRASAGLVLETTLLALHADLTDAARPAAHVSLAVLLLDPARTPPRIAGQAMIEERAPIAGTGAGAIVAGMNAALAACLARVEQVVRAA
jgi:cholesterol transport system auxiliary component